MTGYIAYDVRDMSIEERALSTTRDPANNPESFSWQFAHYGWTFYPGCEDGSGGRLGEKLITQPPPLIPGTTHINTNEAIRIM